MVMKKDGNLLEVVEHLEIEMGAIILPVIVIKRTDLTFDENLPQSFKHDVKDEFINVVKSNQWLE